MRLNLAVIADYIKNVTIIQRKLDSQNEFRLRFPVPYQEGDCFQGDRVYIAAAHILPPEPDIVASCSIVCIGYPSFAYNRPGVELLCLLEDISVSAALREVMEVFDLFYRFETDINHTFLKSNPFHALGEILFSLFQSPIQAMTCYDKILFAAYDRTRPEFAERYRQYASEEYVPLEERFIIGADREFSRIFSRRGAFFCEVPVPVYGVAILMYNLYDGDVNYGYIYMEEAYRKIRESDYRLIEWAGEYLIRLLKKSQTSLIQYPEGIQYMMTHLITNHFPYQQEYDLILNRRGWKRTDSYLCLCGLCAESDRHKGLLIHGAVSLTTLNENQLTVLEDQTVIQVINLRKAGLTQEELIKRLRLIIANSPLYIGISDPFSHFDKVHIYYRQALAAVKHIMNKPDIRIGLFEQLLPEMLLEKMFEDEEPQYFLTRHLRRLIDYDSEKNTEFLNTLKAYLAHNKSAARVQELLHISRATCIYRIRRIEEISGMDLDDPDTVLYLQLIFRRGIV